MSDLVNGGGPAWISASSPARATPATPPPKDAVWRSPSRLEQRLRSGGFAVVAEIKPPDTADLTGFVESVEVLRGYADTIELTDMPMATPHIANIAPGALLAQRDMPGSQSDRAARLCAGSSGVGHS